jgi:hypothetical protein
VRRSSLIALFLAPLAALLTPFAVITVAYLSVLLSFRDRDTSRAFLESLFRKAFSLELYRYNLLTYLFIGLLLSVIYFFHIRWWLEKKT